MRLPTAQIMWCNYRVNSIPVDHIIDIWPDNEYPHGRKALRMSQLWESLRITGTPGVLWLDPDVAADPDDLAAMEKAVLARPDTMHTGMLKLWPESTGRDDWIWSHRGGTLGFPAATQNEYTKVAYVAQGFLWTPARLLDLVFPAHEAAQWAEVDVLLSETALANGIPARAVYGCRPKHLHFTREHDGQVIHRKAIRTTPGSL